MTDEQKSAMEDLEVRDCASITGTFDCDGEAPSFRVGVAIYHPTKPRSEWPVVTRITLQKDVHSEYCLTARACVWIGEKLYFECPYRALTAVEYPL